MANIETIEIDTLNFAEGAAPATPSAASVVVYSKADGLMYSKDDAGVETLMSSGAASGAVATDAIWDAAGDLAVGSGANTAARLAAGAAGGVLAMGNSAVIWNAGTSFPASKATNDRYWRTDLDLEFYWDGTQWLSTTLYREPIVMPDTGTITNALTVNSSIGRFTPWAATFDLWLVAMYTTTFVSTTNNGTNFWTIALKKYQSDFATNVTAASRSTSADAASTVIKAETAIGALWVPATYPIGQIEATKTLTPGSLSAPAVALSYRLVGV